MLEGAQEQYSNALPDAERPRFELSLNLSFRNETSNSVVNDEEDSAAGVAVVENVVSLRFDLHPEDSVLSVERLVKVISRINEILCMCNDNVFAE